MPGRVTNEFLFTALKTMDLGVACDPINAYNDHCTMNKTLEYMAFSRAQVMFDTREGRYSAGEAARYVTENSAEKLADAILEMIDNPEECERMGSLGYERLTRQLSWKRSVAALLAAYDRACHRS
jgi:glycosyltransferase involved in cell wall biosynthesis